MENNWKSKAIILEERFKNIENSIVVQSVIHGLTSAMPLLFIGSATLVIRMVMRMLSAKFSNPSWLTPVDDITMLAYNATFGLMAVYMVILISIHYMKQVWDGSVYFYGAPITSLMGFIILSDGLGGDAIGNFGVRGMFTAIVAAILASWLYRRLWVYFNKKRVFTAGADVDFNDALSCILPMVIVLILFSLVNYFINIIFGVSNFQELFVSVFDRLFRNMGRTLGSGLLFVFLSSLLWFFGIHGTNVLENVTQEIFVPGVELNLQAIEGGNVPTEIFSKNFFDIFVFMGGCGSLMCLLIAVLLFSKRKSSRSLGRISAIPVFFNVNELIVIGFPIICNPYLLIPFILTPLVCTLTSAAAMYVGWVPLTVYSVDWTTPVLFSGYYSTGSFTGCVLQIVNLIIGVCIYRPFLKLYDKSQEESAKEKINALVSMLQENEDDNKHIVLIEQNNILGDIAKTIAMDLKRSLRAKEIQVFYQPQYNEKNECIGAEALLRWRHMEYGMTYPPLTIKLAEEIGILLDLEKYVFQTVVEDVKRFEDKYHETLTFSINLSVPSLMDPRFEAFLISLVDQGYVKSSNICIEVTERMAVRLDEEMKKKFERLHNAGYLLAIDDFGMGNTSLKYLQGNQFNFVKIDGILVRSLNKNVHSEEIIKSIVYLSQSLGFSVVAEYVENEEIKAALENIGCRQFQGYLYSKALPYDEFCEQVMGI